jgi:hypothetical protein
MHSKDQHPTLPPAHEEMDFVADYGLMNFSRHLPKRFHCLIIVLLISKETSMSALQLKVA